MRQYEWWTDRKDVDEALKWCLLNTKTIVDYFIEMFKIEIPCNINLRLIKEGI